MQTRLLLVLLAFFAAPAPAQSADRSFAYGLLVGSDTAAIEWITVQDGRWTGNIYTQTQGRVVWTGSPTASGRVTELELRAFQSATDTVPMQIASLVVVGDSVRMTQTVPAFLTRMLPTQTGASLLVNASLAMIELLVRSAGESGGSLRVFLTSGGQTLDVAVRREQGRATVVIAGQATEATLAADGTVRSGTIPLQNTRFIRIDDAGDLARLTLRTPNYDAPAGAPYTAEHVRIPVAAGHELAATLTKPGAAQGRLAAVVTISGSGSQDRDELIPIAEGYRPFRQFADTLGRRGIAVLRFDDRGFGGSSGNVATATSADFADDVRAIVAWLRARPDIDPQRILLLGHSEGAMIAPMVAATDSALAGIVLLAGPSRNGLDIIRYQQRYLIDRDTSFATVRARDSAATVARAGLDSLVAVNAWVRFFAAHDPLAFARRVRVPALVLHGETDRQVTAEQANELAVALRAGGGDPVDLQVFAGLNHLFLPDPDGSPTNYARIASARIGPEVLGLIADWIVARTSARVR